MTPPEKAASAAELAGLWRELEGVYGAIERGLARPKAAELERLAREMERIRARIEERAGGGTVAPEGTARQVAARLAARHGALVCRTAAERDARRAELAQLGRARGLLRAYGGAPRAPRRSQRV